MKIWLKTVTSSYWKPQIKWIMGSICCDWFAVSCKEIKSQFYADKPSGFLAVFSMFTKILNAKYGDHIWLTFQLVVQWHDIGDFRNGRWRLLSTFWNKRNFCSEKIRSVTLTASDGWSPLERSSKVIIVQGDCGLMVLSERYFENINK